MIALSDPDRMRVELIETAGPEVTGAETAEIGGFHSVTLWLTDPARTARVLTDLFGYREIGEEAEGGTSRFRFQSPAGGRGSIVDLIRSDAPSIGRQGAGSIHHVAFRAETKEIQQEWRERVLSFGLDATPVIDRQYFDAIYFREPGGVLFEIATDPPGFAIDEAPDALGAALRLPPQYEAHRAEIERRLPPIRVPA